MKLSYLILGMALFFIGLFFGTKIVIAVGIIIAIISFSEKKVEVEEKKQHMPRVITSKEICSNCGAEILSGDNYCPGCGKKVFP